MGNTVLKIIAAFSLLALRQSHAQESPPQESPKLEQPTDSPKQNNTFLIEFKKYMASYAEALSKGRIEIKTALSKDFKNQELRNEFLESLKQDYKHVLLMDHGTSFTILMESNNEDKPVVSLSITSEDAQKNNMTRFMFQLSISALNTVISENFELFKQRLREEKPFTAMEYQDLMLKTLEHEIQALNNIISDENVPEELKQICKDLLNVRTKQHEEIKKDTGKPKDKKLSDITGQEPEKIVEKLQLDTNFTNEEKEIIETANVLVNSYVGDFENLASETTLIDAKCSDIKGKMESLNKLSTLSRAYPEKGNFEAATYCIITNNSKAVIVRFISPNLIKQGLAHALVILLHEKVRTYIYLSNLKQGLVFDPLVENHLVLQMTLRILEDFIENKNKAYKGEYTELKEQLKKVIELLKKRKEEIERQINKKEEQRKKDENSQTQPPQSSKVTPRRNNHLINQGIRHWQFVSAARHMRKYS